MWNSDIVSGDPAAFVLADEAPHNQLTPITADHPANPRHSNPSTFPGISAPHISPEQPISSSREPGSAARPSLPSLSTLLSANNPRRRRRSPSVEEPQAEPAEEALGYSRGNVDNSRREADPSDRRLLREKPSSPKRRRLGNKSMRLDPESSNSNGAQHNSNGSPLSPVQKSTYSNPNSTNGHSSTNGAASPHKNGASPTISRAKTNSYFGHDREEVTRLLIQGLGDLGYYDAAERLSVDIGYHL